MTSARRVAVIGGGWAGLAAAVTLVQQGKQVTLYEMAPQLGGRARQISSDGSILDNGQHILIGAYKETLALMASVGVDLDVALRRQPLALVYPDGSGLHLAGGAPVSAFVRAVCSMRGWSWGERLRLLGATLGWAAQGFRCQPALTVAQLVREWPGKLRDDLIEPLCVAALNTPVEQASAAVFLRVLRDALFSGPGSADLLLPRVPLSALLPDPAQAWLSKNGAAIRLGSRVRALTQVHEGRWRVDDEPFDAVILANSALEAARLTEPWAAQWSACAAAIDHESIVTVYLHSPDSRLPSPMMALHADARAPAQFIFDLGALGRAEGVFACVVSGAGSWVARGLDGCTQAALQQALAAFPADTWLTPPRVLRTVAERRATFLCSPALKRPACAVAPGLHAAGDYIAGPYPATLEGAVRSGVAAAQAAGR